MRAQVCSEKEFLKGPCPQRSRWGPLVPDEATGDPWSLAKPLGPRGPQRSRWGPLVWSPAKPLEPGG